MPEPLPMSRRTFLSTGATLLASIGVGATLPGAPAAAAAPSDKTDLALYRPVAVSSTDYAPTPAEFAVDGLAQPGVRGSGWRAAPGDAQWISVDLEAPCRVEAVTLTFEATAADPAFNGNYGETDGTEIRSSAATAYALEISTDGRSWQKVHEESAGAGGVQAITLEQAVTARWVRLGVTRRSTTNPVGLNGFQVYGTPPARRPHRTGWTDWAGRNTRPAPALTVAGDGTVPLESGWSLTLDDFTQNPIGDDVDVRDWLPATVPGTVLATLVDQGHLPDPVAGFANLHIPEALSRHAWWYRRELRLPKGFALREHVWLELDGVNHAAIAWVNGAEVGTVVHPFARAAFDITEALRGKKDHAIAVKVTPMPHPGTPGDKGPDGNTFVQSGHLHLDSPTYLAASGWDWMPAVRDRVAGIWDHIRLRSTGVAVIGDPHITTKVPSRDTATVTIAVPVRNAGATPATVTVQASFDKTRLTRTATVAPGQSVTVAFDPVTVRKPRLWWPNGYGDPNLYDLTLTASVAGKRSDERATRFGIREFSYDWDAPVVISPPPQPPLVFDGNVAIQNVTFARQKARYVRIQGGQRATGWGISMWSLSIADGATGADLALRQPVTASGDDGSPATQAVDGNPGSRWSSRYQDNEWIQVDLGADKEFDQVTIAWETAYALDYRIQIASAPDGPFTDVKAVSNETPIGDTGLQVETFAPQSSRYVRIVGDRRATEWGISLWTLTVGNGDGGPDLALRRPVATSGDDGNPGSNAVDGNPRTRWSSRYQDGEWLRVDLGDGVTFDRVAIAWEQAYARAYRIQVSDDGDDWTDVKAVDNSIRQLRISVNNVPVFVRGGNWGWDELLRRVPAHRTAETVAMHRDMNFTMIRNWLGSSNRDELYAACDENGILVWNDFWQAGGFQPNPPGYVDIAGEVIRRFRHHPSIVVWCGANEAFPPPIVDAGLKQAVETEDPEVLYIQNSAGWIVSGHGPYRWIDPATYNDKNTYDTQAFGFHTEIGMPVIPHVETMRNLVGDEPGWPISAVWNYHDWSERGNQRTDTYRAAIDARLGESASLEQFAARAQFVNYESHRAMFEAWNANLWDDATALLLWMSHPAWYSTVWQTYDYDLDVNGAYYGSRKACEPRHVQADPATWQVRAVNHTTTPLAGDITARHYDLAGRQLGTTLRQRVEVAPSATRPAFSLAAPVGHPLHLVRLELRDAGGHVLSENTYWRYEKDTDMRALTAMTRTRLGLSSGRAGGSAISAAVTNRGPAVAALVRLALRDENGDRVLPARYDDNYFWLLPGESRRVTVSWPSRLNGCRGVHVTAEAYNAGRVTG
ncbi:discoidin domain-containing protein [Actinoplanes sp. CA-142083]|uniref:discoidin domain-containing protein n=1 Tax=Actinoplanes sp. CA-142083 TaxID=3239903 RepID=UPI003D92A544